MRKSPRRRKSWALAAAALAVTLVSCTQANVDQTTPKGPIAHQFTLVDQDGRKVTVGQRGGTPTALYFGFTHCKDICPQTMQRLQRARAQADLTPKQLRIVMVTVDPARDTPSALRAFIERLHAQAIALTGSKRALASVYRSYGVVVQRHRSGDAGHTDYIYLIARNGRLQSVFSPQDAVNDVAQKLRAL